MSTLFYALVRFITIKVTGYNDGTTLVIGDGLKWIKTYHQIASDINLVIALIVAVSIVIFAYIITMKFLNKKYNLSE